MLRISSQAVRRVASASCRLASIRSAADAAPAAAAGASARTPGPQILAIVDQVEKLTLIEVADLVSELKKRFNISDVPMAAVGFAPQAAQAAAAAAPAAKAEEKTAFTVKLVKFDEKSKIKVIKEVRNILPDLKLADAKKLVEEVPQIIKTEIPKDDANKIKELLVAAGGVVEIE